MLSIRPLRLTMAVCVPVLWIGLAGPAQAALPQTLVLDSYSAVQDGAAGPVQTDPLPTGGYFTATVTGTYSPFGPALWIPTAPRPRPVCGVPENDALIPSPGRPQSKVGQDPAFSFARPKDIDAGCPTLPRRRTAFQIADHDVFAYRPPIGGQPAAPNPQHSYRFLLAGSGSPARFQLRDDNVLDNYGVLTIAVRVATDDECGGIPACLATAPPGPAPGVNPGPGLSTALANGQLPTAATTQPNTLCASRRRFRINVRYFARDPVVRAIIRLATPHGRRLKVTRRYGRVGTTLSFVGNPSGRIRVYIYARTRSGRLKTGARTYRLCTPRDGPLTLPKL